MFKRFIGILAVNVIVFCVLAEVVGLVVFYYQHGWLFYVDPYRPQYAVIPETQRHSLTKEVLHPYFGPAPKPGLPFDIPPSLRKTPSTSPRLETNNFGFVSPHNYPFGKSRKNQFVIGIFGGSVGVWFCQVGADRLIQDLKQSRFFANKELIALCLSHEGYKQPQQLLLLAYFLSIGQEFDLVINIDGFNEVALSNLNNQQGWDISMPSVVHLDPLINLVNQATLTQDKLNSLAEIGRYKERLNALAERLNRNRLASINFALERYHAILTKKYQDELVAFDKLPSNPADNSLIHATPTVTDREGRALFVDIARQWVNASVLMHQLLAARGVPYFHFLQPNQYYTTRVFRAPEAKVALNTDSSFKSGVEQGYPVLVEESQSNALKNNNVRFFSGIHIFDDEPSPVYLDDCCHYTLVGNELLADFIARSVLNSKGLW